MPNAAQLRLSRAGLDFIEGNVLALAGGLITPGEGSPLPISIGSDGVITLPLNNSLLEGADLPVDISICPDNNCQLDISLASLTITPADGGAEPDRLDIAVQIDISSNRDTPVTLIGQTCTFNFQTDHETPDTLNVSASASFSEDADGYGVGETPELIVDLDSLDGLDLQLSCPGLATFGYFLIDSDDPDPWDSGGSDNMARDIMAEVKTTLNEAMAVLMGKLFTFCQASWAGQCPSGSHDVDGVCIEDGGDTCRPARIGFEGNIDATELLSGIFPGTPLVLDFLFAMQGEAHAVSNGFNLDFFAGVQNQAGIADCVAGITLANPPTLPTDIPLASAIQNNEDAHIAIGVSERMMDWAGYQLWEGGTICIEAGTRLSPLLSTTLFSVFIGSLKTLVFPDNFPGLAAPLSIAVRPGTPPDITIGEGTEEDPRIQIDLVDLDLHFYVWTSGRYARFMTYTTDLHIGVNIVFNDMGEVVPEIVGITPNNSVVSNADLISEDDAAVETAMDRALGVVRSFAADLIPAISLAGLGLPVPLALDNDTLQLVEEGDDRFLGVFVNLGVPSTSSPFVGAVETNVEVLSVTIPDRAGFAFETFGVGEPPRVELAFQATGPEEVEYEYQHRLNDGTWSEWSRSPYAVVQDPMLFLQGRHTLEARSRVVGTPDSVDRSPATSSFVIDVLAPELEVGPVGDRLQLAAMDVVTATDDLEYRFRSLEGGEWSGWQTMTDSHVLLPQSLEGEVLVEVRDEVGNVASNAQALRGLAPPSDGGGCGDCSVDGTGPSLPTGGLAMLMMLAVFGTRRRRS